ncbi:MAG: hypothetical protein FGM54_08330 [Chitinophagaceae bacterium]|nr:hypothetical protein [Chitinophagaceae bacterium]
MPRFEQKKQALATKHIFAKRVIRFSLFAFALVAFSVGIGTWGYHILASLSWIDSFHMACLILTGMGPVVEMQSNEAKLFSSFYALYSGVAFLTISAVFFAPLIHRLLHILNVDDEAIDDKEQ